MSIISKLWNARLHILRKTYPHSVVLRWSETVDTTTVIPSIDCVAREDGASAVHVYRIYADDTVADLGSEAEYMFRHMVPELIAQSRARFVGRS